MACLLPGTFPRMVYQTRGTTLVHLKLQRRRCCVVAILPKEPGDVATSGSITYKRSSVQRHYECYSTLEVLGLSKVSSELSRGMANSIGLVHNAANVDKDTPVVVSFDVSREKKSGDLTLEGVVKTAVAVQCNRCLAPMAEKVFASFSLLLTKDPVEEPTQPCIGVVLGEEADEADGPTLDLDLDDKMHFPADAKEVDISAYIRDTIHLELPYVSLCSSSCKGVCIQCGQNRNTSQCGCSVGAFPASSGEVYAEFEITRELPD